MEELENFPYYSNPRYPCHCYNIDYSGSLLIGSTSSNETSIEFKDSILSSVEYVISSLLFLPSYLMHILLLFHDASLISDLTYFLYVLTWNYSGCVLMGGMRGPKTSWSQSKFKWTSKLKPNSYYMSLIPLLFYKLSNLKVCEKVWR